MLPRVQFTQNIQHMYSVSLFMWTDSLWTHAMSFICLKVLQYMMLLTLIYLCSFSVHHVAECKQQMNAWTRCLTMRSVFHVNRATVSQPTNSHRSLLVNHPPKGLSQLAIHWTSNDGDIQSRTFPDNLSNQACSKQTRLSFRSEVDRNLIRIFREILDWVG